MDEFLKGDCPYCGQSIEFPAEGVGQTVPCPTCDELFVLKAAPVRIPVSVAPKPLPRPEPMPTVAPLPAPPAVVVPSTAAPAFSQPKPVDTPPRPLASPATLPEKEASRPVLSPPAQQKNTVPAKPVPHPETARFEQACRELETEPAFAKHPPTREQTARAWAWAKFQKADTSEWPSHAEMVAAMKKLFAEYKDPKAPRAEIKGR